MERRENVRKKVGSRVGRKLLGGSRSVACEGELGSMSLEERREEKVECTG